eukprot:TRINITY_DN1841_c0_g2_i13.p1 TRINITY_DN1841_c0_g2~~TRINITY_DN1841_c0_g2_i13.p1  ORF type:complete len:385 (-),score=9.05 TRINITY_DN1841_c0_g2_i13:2183-3241(-)
MYMYPKSKYTVVITIILLLCVFTISKSQDNKECGTVLWFMNLSWYPAVLDRINDIKVAVLTARRRAPKLKPVIMFDPGFDQDGYEDKFVLRRNRFVQWLQSRGVIVCDYIDNTLHQALKTNLGGYQPQFYGIYARLVFDQYIKQCVDTDQYDTEYVLYTDSDVVIMQNIDSCNLPKPKILSMGAEFEPDTIRNSGVMVFHVDEYIKEKKGFFRYNEKEGWFNGGFDQDLLLGYFKESNKIEQLPNQWNFKMYWKHFNLTVKPIIIHSHGPKLGSDCLKCLMGVNTGDDNDLIAQCNARCSDQWIGVWIQQQVKNNKEPYQHMQTFYDRIVFQKPPYYNQSSKTVVVNNCCEN